MKLAVSLPADLFRDLERVRSLERVRRKTRKKRSALVAEALASWLSRSQKEERLRRYEEGYRRYPETREEIEAAERAAEAILDEIPWEE